LWSVHQWMLPDSLSRAIWWNRDRRGSTVAWHRLDGLRLVERLTDGLLPVSECVSHTRGNRVVSVHQVDVAADHCLYLVASRNDDSPGYSVGTPRLVMGGTTVGDSFVCPRQYCGELPLCVRYLMHSVVTLLGVSRLRVVVAKHCASSVLLRPGIASSMYIVGPVI